MPRLKRKTKKRGYRGKSPRRTKKRGYRGKSPKNKAGSLKKSVGRFISKRRTDKSIDRSLQRKYTSERIKQQKKTKTKRRREKATEFKTHLLPASESATGSPIETLIKWDGYKKNKVGQKMYSIYQSSLLNIDPKDESAKIDGLYYVKGKKNKKGTYTWGEPRSRSKSPKGLGFTLR